MNCLHIRFVIIAQAMAVFLIIMVTQPAIGPTGIQHTYIRTRCLGLKSLTGQDPKGSVKQTDG